VVGAWVNVSQGLSPTGKDWLRRRVRASKYGVYESAGLLGLVPVRQTAPLLLTFAMKPFGSRQWELVRVAVAMSGKEAALFWARAWERGWIWERKNALWPGGGTTGVLSHCSRLSLPL